MRSGLAKSLQIGPANILVDEFSSRDKSISISRGALI